MWPAEQHSDLACSCPGCFVRAHYCGLISVEPRRVMSGRTSSRVIAIRCFCRVNCATPPGSVGTCRENSVEIYMQCEAGRFHGVPENDESLVEIYVQSGGGRYPRTTECLRMTCFSVEIYIQSGPSWLFHGVPKYDKFLSKFDAKQNLHAK